MAQRRKPKIRSKIELHVYNSLELQLAYQQGIATALAGTADVISQFAEYALKNGKLPDFWNDEEKKNYIMGMTITFNGTAEVFNKFTDHLITDGEKALKEKGWKGLRAGTETEDDLK